MANVKTLYKSALKLSEEFDQNFLELAETLNELHKTDADQFQLAVSNSGIGRRKAYYLVNIAEQFRNLPAPKHRLQRIGWTKLQLISSKVTSENVDELLSLAESHTAQELKTILSGGKVVANTRAVLLYFSPKDYEDFEKAVIDHGGKRSGRGLIDKEEALMRLVKQSQKGV